MFPLAFSLEKTFNEPLANNFHDDLNVCMLLVGNHSLPPGSILLTWKGFKSQKWFLIILNIIKDSRMLQTCKCKESTLAYRDSAPCIQSPAINIKYLYTRGWCIKKCNIHALYRSRTFGRHRLGAEDCTTTITAAASHASRSTAWGQQSSAERRTPLRFVHAVFTGSC